MDESTGFSNSSKCDEKSEDSDFSSDNVYGLAQVKSQNRPVLDSSLPYIPVYTHLVTHDLVPIERPVTPPVIKMLRAENRVDSSMRKTPESKGSSRTGKRNSELIKRNT